MNLYEINQQIEEILSTMEVDEETGEVIFDFELLGHLEMQRDVKIENIACYVKNLEAEVAAFKLEEDKLKARRLEREKKSKSLMKHLDSALQGNKFETAKCKCSYRKSTSVNVDEEVFLEQHKDLCQQKTEYSYNKNDLKKMLAEGVQLSGVSLEQKNTLSVK